MTTFYLLRHGMKETVMGDPPLSEVGVRQAEETAKYLKQFSIISIYSSPLLRAQQTAEIAGKALDLPISTDERLLERMNWGDKEDETYEEFLAEWDKTSKDRNYQPIHGDSAYNAGRRFENLLLESENKYKDKEILIVTHGGVIGDFLQNNFNNLELTISSNGVKFVKIFECSLTYLSKENDKFNLKKVGDISHLSEVLI